MPDIRLATLIRLANSAGVTILGYTMPGGKPVGLDPTALFPTAADIGAAKADDVATALALKQSTAQKGLANGYAGLDGNGKIPAAHIPAGSGGSTTLSDSAPAALGSAASGSSGAASRADHVHPLPAPVDIGASPVGHTHNMAAISGLIAALEAKLNAALLGAASGIATLGIDGKVPVAQLPAGLSQAELDAKADAATTNAALATKAATTYVDAQLALKLNANDTRVANAIQPDYLATVETFGTNYTAAIGDRNKIKRCTSSGSVNVTLPALAVGTVIRFNQGSTGSMTFVAGASQAIESVNNAITSVGKGANIIATVVATNIWNIDGGIA